MPELFEIGDFKKTVAIRRRRKSKIELVCSIVFFALIELTFVSQLDAGKYVGLCLIVVVSLLCNLDTVFTMFIFFLPNQRVIVITPGGATLLNLIVILILFRFFFLSNAKLNLRGVYFVLFQLAYFSTVSLISGTAFDLFMNIKIAATLIFFQMLFTSEFLAQEFYHNIVVFLAGGCIISSVYGILLDPSLFLDPTVRFSAGDLNNPNIFASMLSFTIANLLVLTIKQKRFRFWITTTLIYLILVGFMTQSRSFLLVSVFCITYIVFFSIMKGRRIVKATLYTVSLVTLIFVLMISLSSLPVRSVISSAFERVVNPRRGDISGGRIYLWEAYGRVLKDDSRLLLFGAGAQDPHVTLGFSAPAHNAFIEIIISYGIIGSILILLTMIYYLQLAAKRLQYSGFEFVGLIALAPIFSTLLALVTGHGLTSLASITQLFIGVLALFTSR